MRDTETGGRIPFCLGTYVEFEGASPVPFSQGATAQAKGPRPGNPIAALVGCCTAPHFINLFYTLPIRTLESSGHPLPASGTHQYRPHLVTLQQLNGMA